MRFGTVAIVGRTNVGKSTFLNACLGEKLAIVSPLPQTTRDELLGVLHRPDAQIAFTDTPGLHRPKNELGRRMNAKALDTLRNHDLAIFIVDATASPRRKPAHGEVDPIHPDDRRLLQMLHPDVPCVLVLNKVDLVKDKALLLPLIAAYNQARNFVAIVPTSVLKAEGVERVLDEVVPHLPEGKGPYSDDTLTNRPVSFFAREYIREQVLLQTHNEVPHAVAVSIDRFEEGKRLCRISATIHVEKTGQRSILVGHGGERIKELGTQARLEIERLVGKQVHLELFVRVSDRWKDMPRQLQELGYDAGSGGRSLENALPPIKGRRKSTPKVNAAAREGGTRGVKRSTIGGAQPKPAAETPGKTAATKAFASGGARGSGESARGTASTGKSAQRAGRGASPKGARPVSARGRAAKVSKKVPRKRT
jgi:GTPase